MKKIFSILLIGSLALSSLSTINIYADSSIEPNTPISKEDYCLWETLEIRKMKLGKKLNYNVILKTGTPCEVTDSNGNKFYQKKIRVAGLFFKNEDKENVISNEFEVKFSYNGVSAWIDDIDKDIKSNVTSIPHSKFKGSTCEKIFNSDSQCIVSEQINVFKKKSNSAKKKWKDADNLHIDAVCSPSGEITFNSKDYQKTQSLVNEVSEKSASLENKVIRKVVEVDRQINVNKNSDSSSDDKYNYITRQMKITYTDLSGKIISSAVIEANFRYNPASKEVECLSTSHANVISSQYDKISSFMRTGNRTKNLGGAYGQIEFKHDTGYLKEKFKETITITCDSNGSITSEINY